MISARTSVCGAEGAVSPANPSVLLEYSELAYSFNNWSLPYIKESTPFQKEPDSRKSKVHRGRMQITTNSSQNMGFLWNSTEGKLLLDLNLNGDLTDDPEGVYYASTPNSDLYQQFTNIHLNLKSPSGNHPLFFDLQFNHWRNQVDGYMHMRWLWQGKVVLNGQEWQIGLIQELPINLGTPDRGNLLLRPWAMREKPFSVYDNSLDTVPFARNLFFHNQAYRLEWAYEGQGTAKYRLAFTEQQPKLGELKLAGKFLDRVLLTGTPDYTVLLEVPGSSVKIPAGRYSVTRVSLREGTNVAYWNNRGSQRSLVIAEGSPATLNCGGPLTNSVTVHRRGKNLILSYHLLGAGGDTYQVGMQDPNNPPRFAVFQGDKQIASGKFEFG